MSLECSDGRNSHHSLTLGLGNGRERTPQWVRGPGCSCITVHTRQGLPAPRCRAKSVTLITSKKLDSEGMSRVWTLGGCLLTRSSLSSGHKRFPSINLSILASLAACPRPVSAPGRTRRPVTVVWETVWWNWLRLLDCTPQNNPRHYSICTFRSDFVSHSEELISCIFVYPEIKIHRNEAACGLSLTHELTVLAQNPKTRENFPVCVLECWGISE